jgi:RNA polymerase sigma-70 factor (ECF subfamily)
MSGNEAPCAAEGHDVFLSHAPLVRQLAYQLTGSVHDAEDVAQEAYLKWQRVDRAAVRDPRSYLARTATTLGLDVLRRRAREDYPGPQLIEPVPTDASTTTPADSVQRAAQIEYVFLTALQELSPLERAAFLLHDVFAVPHEDVARMLDRTPPATRQLTSRARRRLRAAGTVLRSEEPWFAPIPTSSEKRLIQAFRVAAETGKVQPLIDLLAEDVRIVADGGGKVTTARKPIVGRELVGRFLVGTAQRFVGRVAVHPVSLNCRPGFLVSVEGELRHAIITIADHDTATGEPRISEIVISSNPTKLDHLRHRLL